MPKASKALPVFDLKILRELPPTQKYLIGVSGGRDSVTLLNHLVESGYRRLVVCHLDHKLRARKSGADARFVAQLARKHCLEFEFSSTNVSALSARTKTSIETAGRNARYQFFADVARRRRTKTIFLGHHADDLVETFLINLFRGTGTAGLVGMRDIAIRRIGKLELKVVRPLLGVWREEIDRYVSGRGLKFREDATNQSLIPLRNRVRRKIVPLLEKELGRPIRKTIWRAASIASDEEAFFDELVPRDLSSSTQLAVDPLRAMPVAVQRRMIHEWLRAGEIPDVSFDLVERVRELLDPSGGVAKTNLPGRSYVRRRSGVLFVERSNAPE